MLQIDYDVLDVANKGLGICFTFLVFAVNCKLIYLIIRKAGFFYTPRSLTIIYLAVGDIFLALFGLVIFTRDQFEKYAMLSCSTRVSYTVYINLLIHFVYATGLIVLAAELVHRLRTSQVAEKTMDNIAKSVALSAFPWILGLIIVLPLVLDDPDKGPNLCYVDFSSKRIRTALIISVIVPAVLAVLVHLAALAIRLSPASITTPAVLEQRQPQRQQNLQRVPGQYEMNVYSEIPVAHTARSQQLPVSSLSGSFHIPASQAMVKHNPNLEGQAYPAPTTQYPVQQYPAQPQASQQYPVQQYPAQPQASQQYPVQQYPAQPQASQQYPVPQYAPQQHIAQYNMGIQPSGRPQNITDQTLLNPSNERNIICIIAIVHFFCVVPSAVLTLIDNAFPNSTEQILDWSFFWLSVFRSFITPIIFFSFIK